MFEALRFIKDVIAITICTIGGAIYDVGYFIGNL